MLSSFIRATPRAFRYASLQRSTPLASAFVVTPLRFYSAAQLNRDEITKRIINVVKAFDRTPTSAEVTEKSVFSKDLGLDSLDVVELLVSVEEEFDIDIPDKVADEIKSVSEAVDYVASTSDAA
ncbi:AER103Wp [Eremothecium gossypii ATCC 10895]|uniref:Acyl carrier protein n=1 Tax=Eremothecium gossypii (strain ATCC 10895 / CBS 109.51 / FGSC 9923 / NRRL Y-1056) TaxID=284811 RepID=Q757B0_EREGS|nr:AER103Wp [Eremothecium gossypii ATCC 10895]AAS52787.1 AER103Wp [Eremothecium gossypii ATCC 10895]AEY97093.1 FAER103Wp [Eremothecium gossypii FDAG1]